MIKVNIWEGAIFFIAFHQKYSKYAINNMI